MPDWTLAGLDALDHFAVLNSVGESYYHLRKAGQQPDREAMTARAYDAWQHRLTDAMRHNVREHYRPTFDAVAPILRASAWDEGYGACLMQANGITGPVRNPHIPEDYPNV